MPNTRARILFDAFHHHLPGHRIGRHIATGGYAVNFGRYSPGDCYHPNGLAFLQAELSREFDIRLLCQPYSDLSLYDADILLVTNPDYPLYEGASPYRWTPDNVDALLAFVRRGGGVLLGVNSFLSRPDVWEENFDIERVSLLFDRLGLRWDPNYMSDENNIEDARSARFRVGYGQGGRVLGSLPKGVEPLLTRDENLYGFHTRIGKGKLAVVGDTGLISNGLVCFPGFDNLAFLSELFASLRPAWVDGGVKQWDSVASRHLSSAPSEKGLSESVLRSLRPNAAWMKDNHYRHLTWNLPGIEVASEKVWNATPFHLPEHPGAGPLPVELNWLSLDSDAPGPMLKMLLNGNAQVGGDATDLHFIGHLQSSDIPLSALCANREVLRVADQIERASAVFEMRLVLDRHGKPSRARWSVGQILYARSKKASHYGYEIVLASASGAIVPRAK